MPLEPESLPTKRIQRWDDIRRSQFGVALTTFTALATGGVGYCAKLISDERSHFSCWASFWFLIATIMFGFGLLAGVFCTWTRLRDARLTAQKHHRANKGATADELNRIKAKMDFWSTFTWFLFHTLVLLVAIGIICISCCVFVLHGHKLFCDFVR